MGHGAATNSIERGGPEHSLTGWPGNGMWTTPFIKTGPDKYLLFFKAGQADAITACFSEYSRRVLEAYQVQPRPHPGTAQTRPPHELARQPSRKNGTRKGGGA